MKRSPAALTISAPSPRSASDSRKRGAPGALSTVGWNCTNSRSATRAPARHAMATPSPVATPGLVLSRNTRAAPPVAMSVARARTATRSPRSSRQRTPAQTPPATIASTAGACSITRTPARPATCCQSTRLISRPVASRACSTRRTLCAPSRASARRPAGSRSKRAPQSTSCRTWRRPSSTSTSTARGSHSPSPAAIVSAAWRAGLSSSPTAAAMPPCAYPVLPSSDAALVNTTTDPAPARSFAARSAAMPLPTIRKSPS